MIQGVKMDSRNEDSIASDQKTSRYKHYFAPMKSTLDCFICGSSAGVSEHVETFGPGGVKLLQYYTYKAIIEKKPAERLAVLKEKKTILSMSSAWSRCFVREP